MVSHFQALGDLLVRIWQATSLEPLSFMLQFAGMVEAAPEIGTNIKLWKCCWARLNYSRDICDNILDDENVDYLKEVQKSLNEFDIVLGWVQQAPMFFYALIAGSLADDFGRKILLVFPVLGLLISSACEIIHLLFIETLPFEFYYYQVIYNFFGGPTVYYLAYYAYGSSASSPEERALRLTRYDAFEQIGLVAGSLLGPIIFNNLGYYPIYGTKFTLFLVAFLYLLIFVKEVVPIQESGVRKNVSCGFFWKTFKRYLITPVIEMSKSIFKKREQNLRWILYVLLFAYSIYWFCIMNEFLKYLYGVAILPNFDGNDWAHLNVVFRGLSSLSGLVVMPILSGRFQLHETIILIIINVLNVVSCIWMAFLRTTWQFWISECLLFMRISTYGTLRSLITKCIHPNEYGKIFSVIGLATALMPFLGNPAYKLLYNATLDSFPGAIFLLTGALYLLTIFIFIVVFVFRGYLLYNERGEVINAVEEVLKEEEEVAAVQERRGSVLLSGPSSKSVIDEHSSGSVYFISGKSFSDEHIDREYKVTTSL